MNYVIYLGGLSVTPAADSNAAAIIAEGLEVLVQEVIAAITTWPLSIRHLLPSSKAKSTGSVCCRDERIFLDGANAAAISNMPQFDGFEFQNQALY